jgi:hypothetical protein
MPHKYEELPQTESARIPSVATEAEPFLRQVPWVFRFWVTATVFFALLSAWLGS